MLAGFVGATVGTDCAKTNNLHGQSGAYSDHSADVVEPVDTQDLKAHKHNICNKQIIK